MEIQGKAKDRADGLREKAASVQSQIDAGYATRLANAKTEDEFGAILEEIAVNNPAWAESLDTANQRDAIDRATVYWVQTFKPDYETGVEQRRDEIIKRLTTLSTDTGRETINRPEVARTLGISKEELESRLMETEAGRNMVITNGEQAMLATVKDMELAGTPRDEAIRLVATDEARNRASVWEDPQEQEMLDRYNEFRDRLAKATETYTDVMNEVVTGTYSGGYDARVAGLPLQMQRDLYAAVGTENEYRRLVNSHPGVDDTFKSIDATYPNLSVGFKERAKRMAMKRVNDWETKQGDTAVGKQLEQLVMQGYADAKDPIYNAMETAINAPVLPDNLSGDNEYWASEARTDYMAAKKKAGAISGAAIKAFSAEKPKKETTDRAWEKQNKRSAEKINKFRSELPANLRPIVDANKELYTKWYSYGNTNAIIEHLKQQSGGL